ncbi:MAG TPA: glutamate--tRNA ligase [Dermatophilaceae bacterium]|nr:glutamate--tRNA ligase [Dermatophilaceae bacterium]
MIDGPTPTPTPTPAPDTTPGAAEPGVRVRFCPSPTGLPHVGMARTALSNWAFARHTGGAFVFRIEDTDATRDTDESMAMLIDALRWLGLDYDEGPDIGGPYAPYRQSQRHDRHAEVARLLLERGYAYESFSSTEEIEARHRAAGRDPKLGYDNHDRLLTDQQRRAFRHEGRQPVLRLRMPEEDVAVDDLIRGQVRFPAGSVPDFVIVRGNGAPLYTLVNPVDDADMRITHVIRGEDLLSSTPRQIALFRVLVELGVADRVPRYAHLPLVMGEGNRKLSKRDPDSNLFHHRDRGFVREGMINYLALLGWAIGPDRDVFSPEEMVAAFDIGDVNPNPARWDQRKAEAINADHIRRLEVGDLASRLLPYLQRAGVLGANPSLGELGRLKLVVQLVQTRVQVLSEAVPLIAPFYLDDDEVPIADDARRQLGSDAGAVLDAAATALDHLDADPGDTFGQGRGWTAPAIEEALRSALVDGLGLKPKVAFTPLRVALSGRRISPPLFESMDILGRHATLARLRRLRRTL